MTYPHTLLSSAFSKISVHLHCVWIFHVMANRLKKTSQLSISVSLMVHAAHPPRRNAERVRRRECYVGNTITEIWTVLKTWSNEAAFSDWLEVWRGCECSLTQSTLKKLQAPRYTHDVGDSLYIMAHVLVMIPRTSTSKTNYSGIVTCDEIKLFSIYVQEYLVPFVHAYLL